MLPVLRKLRVRIGSKKWHERGRSIISGLDIKCVCISSQKLRVLWSKLEEIMYLVDPHSGRMRTKLRSSDQSLMEHNVTQILLYPVGARPIPDTAIKVT